MFMMWAIHVMYKNPMYTALAGFMFGVPLVLSFMVGPLVDQMSKQWILRLTELVKTGMVTLILVAHLFWEAGIWFYLFAILVFSVASLFGVPAHTALLPHIVKEEDLVQANALINMAGLLGGLVLGFGLFRLLGQGADFTLIYAINAGMLGISFFFSLFLKGEQTPIGKGSEASYWGNLKAGFTFIKQGVMLPIACFMAGMMLFSEMAYVNLPAFAQLHLETASGYILLSALAMVGGVVGSWLIGILAPRFSLHRLIIIVFILAGVTRILFVNLISGDNLTRTLLVYLLYVGLGSVIAILYKALIQKLPPKGLISRVDTGIKSLSALAGAGGALLGGFLGGYLGDLNDIFLIHGAAYVVIGILLLFSKGMRDLPQLTATRRG